VEKSKQKKNKMKNKVKFIGIRKMGSGGFLSKIKKLIKIYGKQNREN